MQTVLFLGHTEADGTLAKAAFEALGAATELSNTIGAKLVVGLYGAKTQSAADDIAGCGAQRFLAVAADDFAQPRYATDAAACEALLRASEATIVIAADSSRNARVLAGVAQRVSGCIDTHVTSMTADADSLTITRWFYRQRIEGSLARTSRPWILLLDPGAHVAWQGDAGPAQVECITVNVPEGLRRTIVQGIVSPPADQQTIRPDAKLLFVAGAGWTKKQKDGQPHLAQAEKLILDFLKCSNASLGSSKSMVELSGENQAALRFMSHLNQVGQTGASPRHPKGLSACCHGEEPHTVGWRFISERRAINLDPNCGWARGKADVLYVADAFEVIGKLNALLSLQVTS
jgi:electron transfer flavoprotein alpha subunit